MEPRSRGVEREFDYHLIFKIHTLIIIHPLAIIGVQCQIDGLQCRLYRVGCNPYHLNLGQPRQQQSECFLAICLQHFPDLASSPRCRQM